MNNLRFDNANMFIVSKQVDFVGKIVQKSKKHVKWYISQDNTTHQIDCIFSIYSGKKKVLLNGQTVFSDSNSLNYLYTTIIIGKQRMQIMIDQDEENIRLQGKEKNQKDYFNEFENVFSQPISNIYDKIFSKNC